MRARIGQLVTGVGYLVGIICGIWGFLLDLAIVKEAAGFWGVVAGFVLMPVTFTVAPWYAGIAWGNWFPLLICYGGGIVATVIIVGGAAIGGSGE